MKWPEWVSSTAKIAGNGGKRSKPRTSWQQLICILDHYGIERVFDIGANRGQYAKGLRLHRYMGAIHSFEPLPDLNRALLTAAKDDPLWMIEPACAIGALNREITFSRSHEDDMSSILPQTALQAKISPSSAVTEELQVNERRLDSLYSAIDQPTHLKIDVQGYENAVLDGAGSLLNAFTSIQLEMALVALYEGEILWQKMIERLDEAGFDLHLIIPGYFERKIARQLQIDGVFVRRSPSRG